MSSRAAFMAIITTFSRGHGRVREDRSLPGGDWCPLRGRNPYKRGESRPNILSIGGKFAHIRSPIYVHPG
uniref:Uncharacterized protein n=1 Tax=Solanum lycopersicum TaxID=4081 RepID=K4D1J3_SOLLC